jgi:predicted transcriptional regulator of viral defense system
LKEDKMRYFERMPTDRFAELAELAADQHGSFTLADARAVGYADNTVAQMARRGRLERVSQGVYRIPFLPPGPLAGYMEAALWPVGARGVLSHATALDLWDVSDVNPGKIHITVPQEHRPQRRIPKAYVVHREDLSEADVTAIEGIPVVTLERAIRECVADHLGLDLIEQAVRQGRERGLLSSAEADLLTEDLDLGRVPAGRA